MTKRRSEFCVMPSGGSSGGGSGSGGNIEIDTTLTQAGKAADAAAVGNALDEVRINDAQVANYPWSSKKIVDTLCPSFTATGNPVTCTPVENYPLGVMVTMKPIQEGEGDPSPDNVRAISGRDSVQVTVENNVGTSNYDIALPETVYGGELDITTGEGAATWQCLEFDGTESILTGGDILDTVHRYYFDHFPLGAAASAAFGYCSHLPVGTNRSESKQQCIIGYNNRHIYLYLDKETFPTADSVKQWLAAQSSAGTPLQIAFQPGTSTTLSTAPTTVPAISGTNTIYTADADSLIVTGKSDPITTMAALENRIAALESAAINNI